MGWQDWRRKDQELPSCGRVFLEPLRILTIALFSLLIPLSFMLIARLACYNHLLTVASNPTQPSPSFYFSLLLYTNPAILYALISILSIATLVHGLTGNVFLLRESLSSAIYRYRPGLYTAWFLLCTLQICVGLGIKGSMAAGVDSDGVPPKRAMLKRIIFLLGLLETMQHWGTIVVKPVVDYTVFGVARRETWLQTVIMVGSFGTLWWWRLRDEVESLAIVAVAELEVMADASVAEWVGWWLYYLTATIGMVRVVKGLTWFAVLILCRRARGNSTDICGHEDKV